MLRQKGLKKLHIIKEILDGVLKQVEAGEELRLSGRQIRRLIERVRIEGDIGIAHKLRGKPSIVSQQLTIYRQQITLGKKP